MLGHYRVIDQLGKGGMGFVFRAEDIFWDIGRLRLKLPRWLGPSELRAGHEELGGGQFAFTLRLKHRWFGTLVDQRVRFIDDPTPALQLGEEK